MTPDTEDLQQRIQKALDLSSLVEPRAIGVYPGERGKFVVNVSSASFDGDVKKAHAELSRAVLGAGSGLTVEERMSLTVIANTPYWWISRC